MGGSSSRPSRSALMKREIVYLQKEIKELGKGIGDNGFMQKMGNSRHVNRLIKRDNDSIKNKIKIKKLRIETLKFDIKRVVEDQKFKSEVLA